MTGTIKYVHAADLHLNKPIEGLGGEINPNVAKSLRESSYLALHRLVELCIKEKADFLLLAGDSCNYEMADPEACFELRDAFQKLAEHNIAVYMVHGNHDPMCMALPEAAYPPNTFIFDEQGSIQPFRKDDRIVALIHGKSQKSIASGQLDSFPLARVTDNADCFQLGLLHCNVDRIMPDSETMEISLEALQDAGLDAWALGHLHASRILSTQPFIAYAGSIQPLSPYEDSGKGCFVVTAAKNAQKWECKSKFEELAPVKWQKLLIEISQDASHPEIIATIFENLRTLSKTMAPDDFLIIDLVLSGSKALSCFSQKENLDSLVLKWKEEAGEETHLLLRSISYNIPDDANTYERDDIIGEIWRISKNYSKEPDKLNEDIDELKKDLQKVLKTAAIQITPDENQKILQDALNIAKSSLEGL